MAKMVIIDEASANPLHIVKRIMPECLTFIASTIQGYEDTVRSLRTKLLNGLRNTNQMSNAKILKEVLLEQAIRYADNDAMEKWLNELLLLDATTAVAFEEHLIEPRYIVCI